MRYPILLVSDPHFTSNPRDEYRWALWAWLREQCKLLGIRTVCFCGDLSDAKDFHPASLVNRLAREIKELSEFARLYFIPGNHEWLKQGEEFWRFLALMGDNIHYFTQPSDDPHPNGDGPTVRFLPFTKTPALDWAGHRFEDYELVFMHQTVQGSRASNGDAMDGEDVPVSALDAAGWVYSGDIHVPQHIKGTNIEYVGSPYHVHFGDSFKPRCVLLKDAKRSNDQSLHFPSISRVTLEVHDLGQLEGELKEMQRGDQIKLRMHLAEADRHDWKRIRRESLAMLTAAGMSVHGMELIVEKSAPRRRIGEERAAVKERQRPQDDVLRYVVAEELGSDALDAALEVIEE